VSAVLFSGGVPVPAKKEIFGHAACAKREEKGDVKEGGKFLSLDKWIHHSLSAAHSTVFTSCA